MVTVRETTDRSVAGWLCCLALLAFSLVFAAGSSIAAKPNAATVAAIFPLWWSAQQSLNAAASADANVVRIGAWPSIVIVQPSSDHGADRLSRAGAWFALDPLALAACFSSFGFDSEGRSS